MEQFVQFNHENVFKKTKEEAPGQVGYRFTVQLHFNLPKCNPEARQSLNLSGCLSVCLSSCAWTTQTCVHLSLPHSLSLSICVIYVSRSLSVLLSGSLVLVYRFYCLNLWPPHPHLLHRVQENK